MKLKQKNGRRGFTLVEMLVATALVMFIMLILSEAFVAGLEAFRTLKGIGDMEERLRAAALIIRADLELDHFEAGVRLSDVNFWRLGNPRQGFVNITQGFTPTSSTTVVTPGSVQIVTVPSTISNTWTIQAYTVLLIDGGTGAAEYVMVPPPNPPTIPPVTPTTFPAIFQNAHPPLGSPAGTSYKIQVIRQFEQTDADGLPSSRATDHVLYMAVKAAGDRQENFFTAHMPYGLPYQPSPAYPFAPNVYNPFFATRLDGSPNPNYVPTTFGDQPTDARFQDPLPPPNPAGLPPTSITLGYKTQWAEVAYFLWPNGEAAGGTPLYALYRCEFKVVPDSRYLNGQVFGMTPTTPLPPPPISSSFVQATYPLGLTASWKTEGFNEISCQLTPLAGPTYTYSFNTPSDLASSSSNKRAFTANITIPGPGGTPVTVPARGPFNPSFPDAWSATLVATDVVSFDVQIAPGGPPASTGGMLATSELPWSVLPNPATGGATAILASGTNDFVDIPTGSFDTALTSNQYSINAVRIILRVWNNRTNQTRQVSIVQQF